MWVDKEMALKYATQTYYFIPIACSRNSGTPSPLLGLDLHFLELLDNLRADTMLVPQEIKWKLVVYAKILFSPIDQPTVRKGSRQAAEPNFIHCVHMGGGDAAWLRHQLTVTSHWVISNELPHDAHSW
jgi:hypothetical protein